MDWPALTAGLLSTGQPRLVVARLTGAAIALGRTQRAVSSLSQRGQSARLVHRTSGGRSIALGDGLWGVALALPHRSWLVSEQPLSLPAASFLNRAVRGLLSGLATLGCRANYFGRDFITIDSGQAGYLSFDIAANGAALLECILPGATHWWLPEDLGAHPPPAPARGNPGPSQPEALRVVTSAVLLEALGKGFAERFGVEPLPSADPIPSAAAVTVESVAGLHWSPPVPTPIGFCEAGVRLEGDRLAQVALRGDLIADSGGLLLAEKALQGAPLDPAELERRLQEIFGREAHTMLGADAAVFAKAIMIAAKQCSDLAALAEKYRALIALRGARDRAAEIGQLAFTEGDRPQRREDMRSVARRFPGALRELDDSTTAQLQARLDALVAALASGQPEPWMAATTLFHEALHEGLALRSRRLTTGTTWAGRETEVCRPPSGRLLDLVWAYVEQQLGLASGEAELLVYPRAQRR